MSRSISAMCSGSSGFVAVMNSDDCALLGDVQRLIPNDGALIGGMQRLIRGEQTLIRVHGGLELR